MQKTCGSTLFPVNTRTLYILLIVLIADVSGVSIIYEEQEPQTPILDDDYHDGKAVINILVDQHNPQQMPSSFYSSYRINWAS